MLVHIHKQIISQQSQTEMIELALPAYYVDKHTNFICIHADETIQYVCCRDGEVSMGMYQRDSKLYDQALSNIIQFCAPIREDDYMHQWQMVNGILETCKPKT